MTRYMEEKLRQRDSVIEKLRLKNSTIKAQLQKVEAQLKQKEEMGDVLHYIDFHQLQIENKQNVAKIEQRNQELLKLKMTTGKIVQVLNSKKHELNEIMSQSEWLKREIEARKEQLDKVKALGLVVKPNDVVKVIKKFVEDRDPDKGTHEVKLTGKKVSGATAMAAAAKDAEAARQEKDRREEKDYWDRMGRVLPEKTERVWSALEKALFKYNDTLKERAKTIDEVAGLQQQNTELKNLLSQYLGSRVNDDLIVPPTQMIKVTPSGRT